MDNSVRIECVACGNVYTISWREDDEYCEEDKNPHYSPCCGESLDSFIDDEFEDEVEI